jgi:hypothetical protein
MKIHLFNIDSKQQRIARTSVKLHPINRAPKVDSYKTLIKKILGTNFRRASPLLMIMIFPTHVRASAFSPREAAERQSDERVAGSPKRRDSVIPCE